jgi:hypothetical protein
LFPDKQFLTRSRLTSTEKSWMKAVSPEFDHSRRQRVTSRFFRLLDSLDKIEVIVTLSLLGGLLLCTLVWLALHSFSFRLDY